MKTLSANQKKIKMSPPETETSVGPKSSARTRKKSKGGCKTCKTRRVKVETLSKHSPSLAYSFADELQCDEIHPVCGNCKTYYSNSIESCEYNLSCLPQNRKIKLTSESSGSRSSHSSPVIAVKTSRPVTFTHHRPVLPKTVGMLTLDPFETQPKSIFPHNDLLFHHCTFPPTFPALPRLNHNLCQRYVSAPKQVSS